MMGVLDKTTTSPEQCLCHSLAVKDILVPLGRGPLGGEGLSVAGLLSKPISIVIRRQGSQPKGRA